MVAIHTLNGKDCYCYIVAIIQGLNGAVKYTFFLIRNWFIRNEYYTGRNIKEL